MAGKLESYIVWDRERDAEVLADLAQYRSRARGARLRALVRLGLKAEPFAGLLAEGAQPAYLAPSAPAPGVATTPTPASALSDEHQHGLDALIDSLGLM